MILFSIFLSQAMAATSLGPTAFPVFLKEGFSSILEFEEPPTQVVLGDQNLFQIEKLNRAIVIKPLTAYAVTNMFVYFKTKETRLFILTASEESEPTYFKNFATIVPKPPVTETPRTLVKYTRGVKLNAAIFDKKKDYLTVDFELSADSSGKVVPNWDLIRLKHKDRFMSPSKLWSARREIQSDSKVKARLIFTKANLPLDLKDTSLVIPIKGSTKSFTLDLRRDGK